MCSRRLRRDSMLRCRSIQRRVLIRALTWLLKEARKRYRGKCEAKSECTSRQAQDADAGARRETETVLEMVGTMIGS